jgi:hypothetical protein
VQSSAAVCEAAAADSEHAPAEVESQRHVPGEAADMPACEMPHDREPSGGPAADLASSPSKHECFSQSQYFYAAVPEPEEKRIPQELKDTVQLIQFVQSAQNFQGLSKADQNGLLQMLHLEFDAKNVRVNNADELERFEDYHLKYKEQDVSSSLSSLSMLSLPLLFHYKLPEVDVASLI